MKLHLMLLLLTALVSSSALVASPAYAADPILPDSTKTPGAVTHASASQLCAKTFHTSAVRDVTPAAKRQVFARYGISCRPLVKGATIVCKNYEVDHLISLELGGSNDINNLWPESYLTKPYNARVKDRLEDRLHSMVCKQLITLSAAQHAIATNWIAEYTKVFNSAYRYKRRSRTRGR